MTVVLTQAMSHAGSFTAADVKQIKTLFQDSLLVAEKDGTIRVHNVMLCPKLTMCVNCTSIKCLLLLAHK